MRVALACASSLLWTLAGCEPAAEKKAEPETESVRVRVRILDWKQTQALVKSHEGKVVVLDLWSTSCAPCLRELPGLTALHKKYGAGRVACITASCDYIGLKDEPPESLREPVLEILRRVNASFENVLLNVPSDELFAGIDLASIPAVYVYGRDGELARRFDNDAGLYGEKGFSYKQQIAPLVEKLLAGN